MDLEYARKQNFDAGREHASNEFTTMAGLIHPNREIEITQEEVAYAFANYSKYGNYGVYIPEDHVTDPDFVEGVEAYCIEIAKMIRREQVLAGKILFVDVRL